MIRPLDLKKGEVFLIEDEDTSQLIKDAIFYLGKKFENSSDSDFKSWLEDKRENGYMEKAILELRDDIYRGDFQYLIPKVDRLPAFVSSVVDYLLHVNNMQKEEVSR